MAFVENADNKNLIIKFLRFMESDSKGTIGLEQSSHQIAIRFFLEQRPFAMELYEKFIETSLCQYFPSIDNLKDTINVANTFKTFDQQSQHFCVNLWLFMYH
jgi:hypothetical protein